MDMYFDVLLGADGSFQIPSRVLESRHWVAGSTLTLMATVHGLIVNEKTELQRLVESRLQGLDPIAAYMREALGESGTA
jgi:hypothetical protein